MAKQKSIIKLQGTISDITFYKSKDGYIVREKGGVDGRRIATDPAFQRTRENGSEFGRAGKSGKLLRLALRPLLLYAKDRRMVSRLTKAMWEVIQLDATSVRGLRNVIDGEAEILTGFEFNINGQLGNSIYAPITGTIDRVTGTLTANLDAFIPSTMIVPPSGCTHFKILSSGAEIDFEEQTFAATSSETAILPWDGVATTPITLNNTVTPASTKILFLAVGIQFYQDVNGTMYPLKNGAFNPLAIVKVDSGV